MVHCARIISAAGICAFACVPVPADDAFGRAEPMFVVSIPLGAAPEADARPSFGFDVRMRDTRRRSGINAHWFRFDESELDDGTGVTLKFDFRR